MVKDDNVLSYHFTESDRPPNYIREAIHKMRSDPASVGTPSAKTKVVAWVAAQNAPLQGIDDLGSIPKNKHLDHVLKNTPHFPDVGLKGTVRPPDRLGRPLPPTLLDAGTKVRAGAQHQNLRSLVESIQDSDAKSKIEKAFSNRIALQKKVKDAEKKVLDNASKRNAKALETQLNQAGTRRNRIATSDENPGFSAVTDEMLGGRRRKTKKAKRHTRKATRNRKSRVRRSRRKRRTRRR